MPSTNPAAPATTIPAPSRLVSRTLLFGGIAGTIGLIGYPLSIPGQGLQLECVGILVALAAFITGFFTGTLFGMPKRNAEVDSDYSLNNSLVEISDWLTKIIVGLGLVNLQQIPGYLLKFGTYVSDAAGVKGKSLDVFAMCSVVYFSVLGLYIGYNYMRLVLSEKYKVADDNILRKKLQEKEAETAQLQVSIEQKEEQKQQLIRAANNVEPERTERLKTQDSLSATLISKAQKKLDKGIIANPIDPQKNQWGGKATNGNRVLAAKVEELSEGVYAIYISVRSADAAAYPLKENAAVLLALHPSFGTPPFRLITVTNGEANVKLFAYGSFTIGAFADDGATELELDLATLPGVSEYFKTH